jgi:hypothetical protein
MNQPIWDRQRLQQLINDKVQEHLGLDYKGAGALKKESKSMEEITKDVSSFANSAGGTIIYGIREFETGGMEHLPEDFDPIDTETTSKEWLEDIILQIRPRISGIRITPVEIGPTPCHQCFIVDIPQSGTAHQARDGRYHRRFNFSTRRMEDYEIREAMNRSKRPIVDFRVKLAVKIPEKELKIMVNLINRGTVTVRELLLSVFIPKVITYAGAPDGIVLNCDTDKLCTRGGVDHVRVNMGLGTTGILFPECDLVGSDSVRCGGFKSDVAPPETFECKLFLEGVEPVSRQIPLRPAFSSWQ